MISRQNRSNAGSQPSCSFRNKTKQTKKNVGIGSVADMEAILFVLKRGCITGVGRTSSHCILKAYGLKS